MTVRKATTKSAFGALIGGGKVAAATSEPVVLGDVLGSDVLLNQISAATGQPATLADVTEGAAMIGLYVGEQCDRMVAAGCEATGRKIPAGGKAIPASAIRISTKDGLKVWAYVTVKVGESSVNIGASVGGPLGKAFASVAKRSTSAK